MGTKKKKMKRMNLLSHTRPPVPQPAKSLSSKATRTLIRSHHTLQKQLAQAIKSDNHCLASSLQSQIEALGGLQRYQQASIKGQSSDRGGDSSKILMDWLSEILSSPRTTGFTHLKEIEKRKYRMLEVGALSSHNACSRSDIFEVERIDLLSQHPSILKQDFMLRPVPVDLELQNKGFDVLSLSLVVNYVPDTVARGEMLKRVARFLRKSAQPEQGGRELKCFPGLFLVLPSSCIKNSRYLDEEKLDAIMESIGYVQVRKKISKKLVYYLWRYMGTDAVKEKTFGKEEVRKGIGRNNFAIVLK